MVVFGVLSQKTLDPGRVAFAFGVVDDDHWDGGQFAVDGCLGATMSHTDADSFAGLNRDDGDEDAVFFD